MTNKYLKGISLKVAFLHSCQSACRSPGIAIHAQASLGMRRNSAPAKGLQCE